MDITDDLNANNYHTAMIRMQEFESVVKELAMIADQSKLSLSSKENKNIARVEGRLEKFAKKSKIKIKKDYSPTQISIDTLYPAETIAELRLADLQDRLDRANAEIEQLRNSPDYMTALNKSKRQALKQEVDTIKQLIAISNKQMFRDHQVELIRAASEEVKKEYAYQTKNFTREQQEILSEWEELKAKYGAAAEGTVGGVSLEQSADEDYEEKFFELMNDIKYIGEEIQTTNKEIQRVLRKVKDLSEDLEESKGMEKEMVAEQIRDLKIKYKELVNKKDLLTQRKIDSQAAYQVFARNKNFDEMQEKYAAFNPGDIQMIKNIAAGLDRKIDQANEAHGDIASVVEPLLDKEIEKDENLSRDRRPGEVSTDDIDDLIAIAKEEA